MYMYTVFEAIMLFVYTTHGQLAMPKKAIISNVF